MKWFAALAIIPALAIGGDSGSSEFAWLVGCWATPEGSAQEVWVADSERSFAGFGVTLDDNRVDFYEILSLRQSEDGSWAYTARPAGQVSSSFKAVQISNNSVVFTNPDHDYPQEIRYRREGNRLFATISLLGGVNSNSFDKVACE